MKEILATILAVTAVGALLPAAAQAAETSSDVLVWYVDTTEAKDEAGRNVAFDQIKFWAVDSDNNKVLGLGGLTYTDPSSLLAKNYSDLAGRTSTATGGDTSTGNGAEFYAFTPKSTFDGPYYTDVTGFSDNGYSFLMELYNGGQVVDWMIQPLALSDIQQASGIYHLSDQNLSEIEDGYNFGETMVPEPTSGLLLLMGGALLALRHRRA